MSTDYLGFSKFQADVEEHGKYHSPDCEHAHTPRCRCWCKGKYHGAKTGMLAVIEGDTVDRLLDPDDKVMTVDMGGQVGEMVKDFATKRFRCLGICGKELAASPVIGKPHDHGHPDAKGEKWWLFIRCPYCDYDTALWKIEKRLIT